jgi:hypothetical protein
MGSAVAYDGNWVSAKIINNSYVTLAKHLKASESMQDEGIKSANKNDRKLFLRSKK